MKIGKIENILKSDDKKDAAGKVTRNGRTYGRLASGAAVFANKDITIAVGNYVIYNEVFQTEDAEGKRLEEPKPVNVIGSVFKTKAEALEAKAEAALLNIEEAAFVASKKAGIAKEYNLSPETMRELEHAF